MLMQQSQLCELNLIKAKIENDNNLKNNIIEHPLLSNLIIFIYIVSYEMHTFPWFFNFVPTDKIYVKSNLLIRGVTVLFSSRL
jgi:hypothetical protein